MGEYNKGKLNWLHRNLPEGLLVDAAWLENKGFSSPLRSKYTASGWLDQVARSVYRRPSSISIQTEDLLRWQTLVISLQTLLKKNVVVGGRTALELQGFSHYLTPSGPREIHLYSYDGLPGWVLRLSLDSKLIVHNAGKLFSAPTSHLAAAALTQQPWGNWNWPLLISTPERAILELLDEVPRNETFHQADMLMDGLQTLSPRRLQALLADCRSVKVKRLFLWFAQRHNHAWLKKSIAETSILEKESGCWFAAASSIRHSTLLCRRLSMPASDMYRRQAALLVRAIPFVAAETRFALKGGTAINLFVRDMPRLSVDIDLTYLPVEDRTTSLKEIDAGMRRIGESIRNGIPNVRTSPSRLAGEDCITKLMVDFNGVKVKIEVTPVLRGCVYEPLLRTVSPRVEEEFGFAEIQVVSFADLYAGKIVAALDRQHPRDLFDVRDLLTNEGIDNDLRKAFVVYILSHNRPMAEVLAPARLDIAAEFVRGFAGMTQKSVTLDDLLKIREVLIEEIVGRMPNQPKRNSSGNRNRPP